MDDRIWFHLLKDLGERREVADVRVEAASTAQAQAPHGLAHHDSVEAASPAKHNLERHAARFHHAYKKVKGLQELPRARG